MRRPVEREHSALKVSHVWRALRPERLGRRGAAYRDPLQAETVFAAITGEFSEVSTGSGNPVLRPVDR
jgi:hypothetical protein